MAKHDPPYDARRVANYVLHAMRERGTSASILSLMKLIYFAHGMHLARYGGSLVQQDFEAWEHGPVIRAVWDSFKDHATHGYIERDACATKFEPTLGARVPVDAAVNEQTEHLLDFVIDVLGHHTAFQLVEMTHENGSPWHTVWFSKNANLGMKIGNDAIREWFVSTSLGH